MRHQIGINNFLKQRNVKELLEKKFSGQTLLDSTSKDYVPACSCLLLPIYFISYFPYQARGAKRRPDGYTMTHVCDDFTFIFKHAKILHDRLV